MDVEQRARAVETLAMALEDEYQDKILARDVISSLKEGRLELLNTRIAIRAIIAALTPPEGYVLVPRESAMDAAKYRWLAQNTLITPRDVFGAWWLSENGHPNSLDDAIEIALKEGGTNE